MTDADLWRTLAGLAGALMLGQQAWLTILWKQLLTERENCQKEREGYQQRERAVTDETRQLTLQLVGRLSQPGGPTP